MIMFSIVWSHALQRPFTPCCTKDQWRTVGQRIGGGGGGGTEWKSDKCEGAKRPSGGRVWEGGVPPPRVRRFFNFEVKIE